METRFHGRRERVRLGRRPNLSQNVSGLPVRFHRAAEFTSVPPVADVMARRIPGAGPGCGKETEMATDEELRDAAIKRIKRKKAFWGMVATYVIVNAVLIVIWAVTGAGYFWPGWILGFWGVGLVVTAFTTFRNEPGISEPEIQREMDRERGLHGA